MFSITFYGVVEEVIIYINVVLILNVYACRAIDPFFNREVLEIIAIKQLVCKTFDE